MKIAVTGSIGSGKSVVALRLAELFGAEHCDTDGVCRLLLEKGEPGWTAVVEQLGKRFLDSDGNIDRALLREVIFSQENVRRQLEGILHPLVRQHVRQLEGVCKRQGKPLVVEVPLLYETGWHKDFDSVVTVYADRGLCLERVVRRDGVSIEQAEAILDSQIDAALKNEWADWVIDNTGTLEQTLAQTEAFFSRMERKPEGRGGKKYPKKS